MKAADIPDDVMVQAVMALAAEQGEFRYSTGHYDGGPWVMTWDCHPEVERRLGVEIPYKVFQAKFRTLVRRKVLDGCPCGCRGDMQVIRTAETEVAS